MQAENKNLHHMRCPECNTEIHDPKRHFCPNCGSPVVPENEGTTEQKSEVAKERKHDEPQLSRGMMIFIVAGILFLIGFSLFQYVAHKNDPEYTRTMIDPDSTLADKNTVKFDTLVPDTAKRDSIQRAEKREAEKILNSIRKKPVEETSESNTEKDQSSEGTTTESTSSPTTEATAPSAEPAPIVAPKPKVEQIENE